jgi:hypothetical protein
MSVAGFDPIGPWTVSEVFRLLPETNGERHELIDGSLLISPAQGVAHQRASSLPGAYSLLMPWTSSRCSGLSTFRMAKTDCSYRT